jgi:glycosyltransferase involved in cell wall biosynthesis
MKICESTIRYYPALGGVEEYVQRIAEGLARSGDEVTVVTSDLLRHTGKVQRIGGQPRGHLNGVDIRRCATLPLKCRDYSVMPGVLRVMFREKFDLIHGHCFMSFPMDAACFAARLRKTPFVFNPYFTQISAPSFAGRCYRGTLGRRGMRADAVVVISDFERRMIEEAGYRPRRVVCIPPGVDHDGFGKVTHNVFERYGLSGRRVVLFAGRLDVNKGIDILLKAASQLLRDFPDLVFVIAGDDFGARESLELLVKEEGIARAVVFTGRLSREDLMSAFKNAFVFAFPSLYEAFGIVLIEAMAAGIPVIATESSAIPCVVSHGSTGLLFPAGDFHSLADALRQVLRDEKLRSTLARDGQAYARKYFSWEKTIDQTRALYQSVLS